MKDSLNTVIAGATGYIGLELIKILSKHPNVKIMYLCATKSTGKSINTGGIIAQLVKAVQELSAKVEALENA